jgi:hypothetical protein
VVSVLVSVGVLDFRLRFRRAPLGQTQRRPQNCPIFLPTPSSIATPTVVALGYRDRGPAHDGHYDPLRRTEQEQDSQGGVAAAGAHADLA